MSKTRHIIERSGADWAASPDVVGFFDGTDYDFLSNFHPSPMTLQAGMFVPDVAPSMIGVRVPTAEHAFQASKAVTSWEAFGIALADDPGRAKGLGQRCQLRPDWEVVKVGIMRHIVRDKFTDPLLAEKLLGTSNMILIEGNAWHDTFWGMFDGEGLNWLGLILMQVRNELATARSELIDTWEDKVTTHGE